jgi:hypothetical protein
MWWHARQQVIGRSIAIAGRRLPPLAQRLANVSSLPCCIALQIHQVLWQTSKLPQYLQDDIVTA